MKLVIRKSKPDLNSCRYILDENRITVKRFINRTEGLKFLKEYDHNFKPSDWEFIPFQQFEEELKMFGTLGCFYDFE